MFRPPGRRPLVSVLPLVILGVAQVTTPRPAVGLSPFEGILAAVLLTLVIGGGLILLAPDYTNRATLRVLEEPSDSLLYGIGIGVVTAIVLAVLMITVVGIVLAVPLTIVLLVFSTIGYLAVGRILTDNWIGVLLVAVGVSAIVVVLVTMAPSAGIVVPVIGALFGVLLGSFGIGAAYLEARGDTRTRPDRSEGDGRSGTDR